MRQRLKVTVIDPLGKKDTVIYLYEGENLMDALERSHIFTGGECGKAGTCGKCVVQVIEGILDITSGDRKRLSNKQISQGYRLACMAYPTKDCTVILKPRVNDDYKVLTETGNNTKSALSSRQMHKSLVNKNHKDYVIAIDIGTTTLALVLADFSGGYVLNKYTAVNPQRVYGADIISRIKASGEGKLGNLMSLIRHELATGIRALINDSSINLADIKKIGVSGNTAMVHFLMGYPCESLGSYPFKTYKEGTIEASADEIFDLERKIPVVILPGISAFVGGDITAGLLACGFDHKEETCLFVDLGTNGEIALGNKNKILVTSASAGPAFEGGNISCGTGCIPGAICHVTISNGKLKYDTIEGASPIGLCGTGLVELVSQLLKEGIIDSTGLLSDEYFDNGYEIDGIKLLQEDIRQLQLAKAAIRAGIEILVKNSGITYEQINKVYIAGGFGYHLDISKAADIGLIPKEITEKAEAAGNTALSGAIFTSVDPGAKEKLEHIISVSKEIHLSNDKDFNDLFIKYISF